MRASLLQACWFAAALAYSSSVSAQSQAGPSAAPAAAPPASPDAAATPAPAGAAAELYDQAFEALALGQRDLALQLLEQLQREHPGDRLAGQAAELRATLASSQPSAPPPAPAEPPPESPPSSPNQPTGSARAELLFFQTVHGIALGAETCVLLECGDARPWALALMLGGGVGIGLSLHFSADGITPGLSRALTSGTLWGLWHGAMLGIATGAFEAAREQEKAVVLGLGLGQLAGLGVGGALYAAFEPTAGQVSLTSSGGIWTTVATGLGMLLVNAKPDGQTAALVLLVASDVGLIAGGYLASRAPMSAGRVLLLDAGGLLGTLGGAGLAVLLAGEDSEAPFVGGLGLLGAASGLSLAYYLTIDWDEDEDDAEQALALSLVPVPGGALAVGRGAF